MKREYYNFEINDAIEKKQNKYRNGTYTTNDCSRADWDVSLAKLELRLMFVDIHLWLKYMSIYVVK